VIFVAEVTKAVQARKEEKVRKAQQQLEESRQKLQSKARAAASAAAEENDNDSDNFDDEAALDASLDQVGLHGSEW
jgi:hypothetical protein